MFAKKAPGFSFPTPGGKKKKKGNNASGPQMPAAPTQGNAFMADMMAKGAKAAEGAAQGAAEAVDEAVPGVDMSSVLGSADQMFRGPRKDEDPKSMQTALGAFQSLVSNTLPTEQADAIRDTIRDARKAWVKAEADEKKNGAHLPAGQKGSSTSVVFPDVCKTPAPPAPFVPIPYPNIAQR